MADNQLLEEAPPTEPNRETVKRWRQQLGLADKFEENWRKLAATCVDIYCGRGQNTGDGRYFNILYANVQMLHPAVYNKVPTPDVRRRFRDKDKTGRLMSQVCERALEWAMDVYDFSHRIDTIIDDWLITGRGVARILYEPTYEELPPHEGLKAGDKEQGSGNPLEAIMGLLAGAMGAAGGAPGAQGAGPANEPPGEPPGAPPEGAVTPEPGSEPPPPAPPGAEAEGGGATPTVPPPALPGMEAEEPAPVVIAAQKFEILPVEWDAFRMSPARRWDEVDWIAFRHYFSREELRAINPEIADEVALDYSVKTDGEEKDKIPDELKRATVWEIWDKTEKLRLYVAPSYDECPLAIDDDPYRLTDFFPVPRPIVAILRPDKMEPIPEYEIYREQARELDEITRRIQILQRALKARGAYAADAKEIGRILEDADDAQLVPMESALTALTAQSGARGLSDLVWMFPIEIIAAVLNQLLVIREQTKRVIFEITGTSDIMRAQTDPRETATAQSLKVQFGTLRLNQKQREVQRFIRDLLRLKAELIVKHSTKETLQAMSGIEVSDEMMTLFENDFLRSVRIDIETNSTLAANLVEDKQDIAELYNALVSFMSSIGQFVQPAGPIPMEAAKMMLGPIVRQFANGAMIEDALDMIGQPDPNQQQMQQLQQALQAAQEEIKGRAQQTQLEAQTKAQLAQLELQVKRIESAMQIEVQQIKAESELKTMQSKADIERAKKAVDLEVTEQKHELDQEREFTRAARTIVEASAKAKEVKTEKDS